MKITYDPKADAMNISFQKGRYSISKEVADGFIVDYSKTGKLLRIGLLDVSKRIPKKYIREAVISTI